MSGLNFGNLATGAGYDWGGNIGDYAFIFIGTLVSFVAAWFSMTNPGFQYFQTQAGYMYRWATIKKYILWLRKQHTDTAKMCLRDLRYVFGTTWFRTVFSMPDYTELDKLTKEEKYKAKKAYTNAMEWSSYVQGGFAYLIGAFFFVMTFFTWYTVFYDNATTSGPGTNVAGWYIALIVLVCLVLLFHKTAGILLNTNWYPPRIISYILEGLVILLALAVLICSAVLATTGAYGFIGTAVCSGLLFFPILPLYLIWSIVNGRAVLYFYERMPAIQEYAETKVKTEEKPEA